MRRHFNKNKKGITLVALVITIIVMLILVGVSVTMTIDGGLFNYAGKAVSDTKISSEKNSLSQAATLTIAENKNGKIVKDELQHKLNNIVGKDKTTVYDTGEDFEVLFKESGLYYELDKNGHVGDYKTPVKDKIPGNIGVDENGNALTGGSDAPYQINCIEDLVVLSNMSRGKGNYINEKGEITELSEINQFVGKYIELMRTLNFESPTSYADLSKKWSYDAEQDAYIIDETSTTNLMEIITDKNGVGFVPIGSNETGYDFKARSFDGCCHEIQNIYEKREGGGRCLITSWGYPWGYGKPTLKNLGITGTYANGGAGLTFGGIDLSIFNCYSFVDMPNGAGITKQCLLMVNCYNGGNINGSNISGGWSTGLCYNVRDGLTTQVVNCCNLGVMKSGTNGWDQATGLVLAVYYGHLDVINCCSIGEVIKTNPANRIDRQLSYNFAWLQTEATGNFENCYYKESMVDGVEVRANDDTIAITKETAQTALNSLNEYVEEHKNDYEVPLVKWKMGTNGYPTLDLKY